MEFEWDEAKRAGNIAKHGIDFDRARTIWDRPVLDPYLSNVDRGERRVIAIGTIRDVAGERLIAVVYTQRQGRVRIISARAARQHEKDAHHRAFR